MTFYKTIHRDEGPVSLIIRATITRNTDAPGSMMSLGGDWLVDLDAVTDDQGKPVELTEDEEDYVIDLILR
jgi:hypothetical protein